MRITTEKLPSISNLWLFIVNKKRFESCRENYYGCNHRITVVKLDKKEYFFKTC